MVAPDGSLTLKVYYNRNTYTVKFDGNGSTSGSMTDEVFKYEEEISVALKDRMDDLKKYKVFLSDFEKKVHYDDEASWLFISDMNKKDWLEFDEKCNKEFLENKKDK